MRRLALLVPLALLAGCAAFGQGIGGGFPTAGDAVVGYVREFCDPVVSGDERNEILVELNAAIVPHRVEISCDGIPPER